MVLVVKKNFKLGRKKSNTVLKRTKYLELLNMKLSTGTRVNLLNNKVQIFWYVLG
jgi:hypothetical protein